MQLGGALEKVLEEQCTVSGRRISPGGDVRGEAFVRTVSTEGDSSKLKRSDPPHPH